LDSGFGLRFLGNFATGDQMSKLDGFVWIETLREAGNASMTDASTAVSEGESAGGRKARGPKRRDHRKGEHE
jgi:hypothetical protein